MRFILSLFVLLSLSAPQAARAEEPFANGKCQVLFNLESIEYYQMLLNQGYVYRKPSYGTYLRLALVDFEVWLHLPEGVRRNPRLSELAQSLLDQYAQAAPFVSDIFFKYHDPADPADSMVAEYYIALLKAGIVGPGVAQFETMVGGDVIRGWHYLQDHPTEVGEVAAHAFN